MNTKKSKFSRLGCRFGNEKPEEKIDSVMFDKPGANCSTPVANKNNVKDVEDEALSPIFWRCTQDGGDDEIDVIWDWYSSPQAKRNRILRHKKRTCNTSPKVTIKRSLSANCNKLKAELEALVVRAESPTEFDENNDTDIADINCSETTKPSPSKSVSARSTDPVCFVEKDLEVLFEDDSLDQDMALCSQRVEESLDIYTCPTQAINKTIREIKSTFDNIADNIDSFDVAVQDLKDEDIERLSQCSEPPCKSARFVQHFNADSRKIVRSISEGLPTMNTMTEFEADLFNTNSCSPPFQLKCSPEEIEKKRREAKAKLELKKKQQDIIKQKREEALLKLQRKKMSRLQGNRKQNNVMFKPPPPR